MQALGIDRHRRRPLSLPDKTKKSEICKSVLNRDEGFAALRKNFLCKARTVRESACRQSELRKNDCATSLMRCHKRGETMRFERAAPEDFQTLLTALRAL